MTSHPVSVSVSVPVPAGFESKNTCKARCSSHSTLSVVQDIAVSLPRGGRYRVPSPRRGLLRGEVWPPMELCESELCL